MAEPTISGLFGLSAFLVILGVNLFLLWRNAPRLAEALGFAQALGEVRILPGGEPSLLRLQPRHAPRPAACAAPVRLAA